MAINIIDLLKSQVTGAVAGQIEKQFGETGTAAQAGVSALIPTILGGLLKQVSAPGGADKLDKTLAEGGYDGSLLDQVSGMFGGGASPSPDLTNKGSDLVSMLFGDKMALIAPILAKVTGLKPSTITAALAMIAPLVMSFLGKQKSAMGLDANGLANMLISQKDAIGSAMPAELSTAMGFGSFAAPQVSSQPTAPAPASGNLAKVLIPVALLAAVGYGVYKYIFHGIRAPGAAGNIVIEIPEGMEFPEIPGPGMGAPAAPAEPVATPAEPATEQGSLGLKMPEVPALPDVAGLLTSLSSSLEKVADADTAKASLPDFETMNSKLEGMSSQFSALPDLVKVKVAEVAKGMLPDLQAMIEKVLAIPGVKDVLQPILDKVLGNLKAFSA